MFNDFFFNFLKITLPVGIVLGLLCIIFSKTKKGEEEDENEGFENDGDNR